MQFMTTRSGRPCSVKAVNMEKHLADVLQTMMEDIKRRDVELLEERKRHEETVELNLQGWIKCPVALLI